jgi:hypothetical protein
MKTVPTGNVAFKKLYSSYTVSDIFLVMLATRVMAANVEVFDFRYTPEFKESSVPVARVSIEFETEPIISMGGGIAAVVGSCELETVYVPILPEPTIVVPAATVCDLSIV